LLVLKCIRAVVTGVSVKIQGLQTRLFVIRTCKTVGRQWCCFVSCGHCWNYSTVFDGTLSGCKLCSNIPTKFEVFIAHVPQ